MLAGDYNARDIDWGDPVLDLFCTNKHSFFKTIDTIPRIFDHDGIILVDMTLKAQINKKPQRRVRVWSKADWNLMKTETTAFCDDFIKTGEDRSVESNWELLASHLKEMQHNQHMLQYPLAHNQTEVAVLQETSAVPQNQEVDKPNTQGSLRAYTEWDP